MVLPAAKRRLPIRRKLLHEQAFDLILAMIRAGELKPGDALPAERVLAAQLGVSRSSLREAIRSLGALNIVKVVQGGRTVVSSLRPSVLMEPLAAAFSLSSSAVPALFEARMIIEPAASRLAATRVTHSDLATLTALATEGSESIDRVEVFLQTDLVFHQTIIQASHNPYLVAVSISMLELLLASRRLTAQSRRVRCGADRDHRDILAAIQLHDAEAAESAMRAHIARVGSAYASAAAAYRSGSTSVDGGPSRDREDVGEQGFATERGG